MAPETLPEMQSPNITALIRPQDAYNRNRRFAKPNKSSAGAVNPRNCLDLMLMLFGWR